MSVVRGVGETSYDGGGPKMTSHPPNAMMATASASSTLYATSRLTQMLPQHVLDPVAQVFEFMWRELEACGAVVQ